DALFQRDEGLRRPSGNRLILRNGTVTIGGIALSAARSKLDRHEHAVRIVHVIAERFAVGEPTSGVELPSRLKKQPLSRSPGSSADTRAASLPRRFVALPRGPRPCAGAP